MSKLFGTDGIRGIANRDLSPQLAMQVGMALSQVLLRQSETVEVVIGRDTRISSPMLEAALAAGLTSGGANVRLLGVVPTPLVAHICRVEKFSAGIMVSASHNSFEYNGIKIFGAGGMKLSDEAEEEIESMILGNLPMKNLPDGKAVGVISRVPAPTEKYVDYLAAQIGDTDMQGIRVLVDCANGSTCSTAKKLFDRLGIFAEYVANSPDGLNINADCGSTHIGRLSELVKVGGYDLAVAFDGDGDRCLAMDENGKVVDGDIMLAIFAKDMKDRGKLAKNSVAITVMSNYGFDAFAEKESVSLVKTKVGDRYVLEAMLKNGVILGGEQSGHIIFSECMTTGDGELTALRLIEVMSRTKMALSKLANTIKIYPQVLINVKATHSMKQNLTESVEFNSLVREYENELNGRGRILIRPSGTEPLIRIMLEGDSENKIQEIGQKLASAAKLMLS